jgi:inosose dehydratase
MAAISPTLSPDKVWLGITPTLWWNDDFPLIDIGIPFEQCVSEMALAGYVGCSIGHKYPPDPQVLKAALDLRGLRADLVVAEFGHAVNPLPVALYANCPTFDDHQLNLLIDGLHEIARIAKEEGRYLCYHPHLGTGVMRADAVFKLFERTDPDLVHMLLDTAHLAAGGTDPLEVVKKFASRVKHIHLKDMREAVVKQTHEQGLSFEEAIEAGIFTVPGNGSIKTFPEILQLLADAGFTGWLMIEAEQNPAKANPLQYAKMARAFLKQHLGW